MLIYLNISTIVLWKQLNIMRGKRQLCLILIIALAKLSIVIVIFALNNLSVQFSLPALSDSFQLYGLQHARLPCPSPTLGSVLKTHVHQVGDAIQPSHPVIPFSSCPQTLPASGSFPISQFFTSGGQSIGVSASASVLSMNSQDWSPLGWTGWISMQSKGLSRVFSNTTVQKHQFFSAQLSL